MNWVVDSVKKTRTFLGEVHTELRKSTWPERSELLESTVVLIVTVIMLAVFVGISDTVLASLVRLMVR